MKTLNILKGVLMIGLGIICTLQINAQTSGIQKANEGAKAIQSKSSSQNLRADMQTAITSLQSLSNTGMENLNGVINSLQNLSSSVNSQTGVANFQNLSNTRSSSTEGIYRSSSTEGAQGKTEVQNLSSSRNESLEGSNRNSSTEGIYRSSSIKGAQGKTEIQNLSSTSKVQKLSSTEVVANLDGVIASLEGMNDNTLNGVITNLKAITKDYKGSSYNSLRKSIKE